MKKYNLADDDSLYEDYFKVLNAYQDNINEYTPVKPHKLTRQHYANIATTLSQFAYILSEWNAVVGQNDSSVYIAASDNISEKTKLLKKRTESKIYDFFYKKLKWRKIQKEIIALIAKEGNAVILLNENAEVIVHSIFRFNVYFESNQKIARYVFVDKNGIETPLKNLRHGVDIFHIKDPIFEDFVIAPSRLDLAYNWIMLEQKGVKANINLFANGFLSNLFLKFDYDKMPVQAKDQTKDIHGKTWFEKFMDKLNDRFRGLNKTARVGHIFGLDSIIEAGKNNKDSQFYELIKDITPERIAWAYSMNLANFGTGSNTTYNNAQTFNDALYDKIGRHFEEVLDECRNEFLAPIFNLYSSNHVYIQYNKPQDPNKLSEIKAWREDYKLGLITIDEFRDKRGLESIDIPAKTNEEEKLLEVQNQKKNFKLKKTIVEKALESKEYTKLRNKIKNVIKAQINKFVENFENQEDISKIVILDKFESFYSFSAFKDILLKFCLLGYKDAIKDTNIQYSSDEDFGIYSDEIIDFISNRIDKLYNGSSEFKSIDHETASQIQTILSKNLELGIKQIAVKILDKIEDISINRAELIAQMEVVNAVETTRNLIYKENNYKFKKALNNSPVTDECQKNIKAGVVDIDYVYEHTVGDGQFPPFHFRCKTSCIYGETKEDLS